MTKWIERIVAGFATGLFLAAGAATAGTVTYFDTTAGGPTWNRPLAGNPPTGLSGVGTAVAYDVTSFTVGNAGTYAFQSTGRTPANWDNFSFLYRNAFNAATPLTNVIVGNDDNPTIGRSGFNATLATSTRYFFVETGFANTDQGAYGLTMDLASLPTTRNTTAGGPTWNRPLASGNGLSGVGTAVAYNVVPFMVSDSGLYAFQSQSIGTPLWDNFSFLYQNAFNASSPLTNFVVGNDDNPTIGLSGFTTALTAGTMYYFVETGFSNTDFGTYDLSIRDVTPAVIGVPEPATVALLAIALLAFGATRRRSRAAA